jgi:hypothetical protein
MIKIISSKALKELSLQAQKAPRLRANLNVHKTLDAAVQRLFIATEPDTYIRPHSHPQPDKWEFFTVLEGRIRPASGIHTSACSPGPWPWRSSRAPTSRRPKRISPPGRRRKTPPRSINTCDGCVKSNRIKRDFPPPGNDREFPGSRSDENPGGAPFGTGKKMIGSGTITSQRRPKRQPVHFCGANIFNLCSSASNKSACPREKFARILSARINAAYR